MNKKNICKTLIVLFLLIFSEILHADSENLLLNSNAETGDTQGWISEPENWWIADDNHITPQEGNYLFWPGGGSIAYTKLYQDVDISEYALDVDSGNSYLHLSGWLVNWDQYPHDRSTLAIAAIDANSQELLYLSRDHRSPSWGFYKIDSQIPVGSRKLRTFMIATRYVGTNNDGHFDNLHLSVDNNFSENNVSVTSEGGLSEVEVGSIIQLYATSTEIEDTEYYWSSSFESVATVDNNGFVTTHKVGRVSIQAEGVVSNEIGYINLYVYSPNSIIIQHPEIGERWKSGALENITWELKGDVSDGTLYYSINGGAEWIEIDEVNNLSSGEYGWQIPDFDITQNDCFIKMVFSGGESVSPVFAIDIEPNSVDPDPTEEIILKYEYLGACGYTDSSSFTLDKDVYITRIRIWYDPDVGGENLMASISGSDGFFSETDTTIKGDSFGGWREAWWNIDQLLKAGEYSFLADSESVCENPSGYTTLILYGYDPDDGENSDSIVILTDSLPDTTITKGSSVQVYGTTGVNHITLESGAKAKLFNVPGGNTVTIKADSSLFNVSRSGATVTIEGTDGTILKIPATTTSQSIIFNDGSRSLIIDSEHVMLDNQIIDLNPNAINNEQ